MGSKLSTRLAIALALQAAIVLLDILISGSTLIIASAALLVPFGLAIVGTRRETAITAVVAFAVGIGSLFWNDTPTAGQAIYRIAFYGLVSLLAVIAARARERATELADRNEALAMDLDATQARLDGILGSLGEAVTVHDERGQTVYANEAAARLLGCESVADVLGAEPGALAASFTITHDDGRPVGLEDLPGRRLMQGESASSLLTHSVRHDTGEAMWLLTKATLTYEPNGAPLAINIIEDVTDAKEAELRQRFLAEAGQLLASTLDYQQTLERVARMIVPRLADWCAIHLVGDDGEIERIALTHGDPSKEALARELVEGYRFKRDAAAGTARVRRTGESELVPRIPDEMLVAAVDALPAR